jgi:FMN phosphatase YigB (HAD superfamily)
MLKVFGFDLDNTLYSHEQYIKGAYMDISLWVQKKYQINYKAFYEWIFSRWKEMGSSYKHIFEESYEHFNLPCFSEDIKVILFIYHNSTPKLLPYKNTNYVLTNLALRFRIVLITDGIQKTQMYKINKLGLGNIFNKIYITGAYGRHFYKPSEKIFKLCIKEAGISGEEMVYIGDNPMVDYKPCKETGIKFIRLRKGEYKSFKAEQGTIEIDNISELLKIEGKDIVC